MNLLVALDALLQEGSVTRAAERLGLSAPAMSHALARLREQLGDPLLVRAGRSMVPTPRAEVLRPRVRTVVAEAHTLMAKERAFAAADLERVFRVHATDHVLAVLGPAIDRIAAAEAPRVVLRFLPNTPDDAVQLRAGEVDLAVGIYGELPPEMRIRQLLTDRLVCVVRADHPAVGRRMTLSRFVALEHIQIAPRGRPGGYLDDMLAARGLQRRIARQVPYFLAGLLLVAQTDYVLTVSERIATALGARLGLRMLAPPLALAPYALSLVWHPRMDGDPAHRWLRELFVEAAGSAAPDTHAEARTRLGPPRKPARPRRGPRA